MAGPGGREIGRLSVRVVPDTDELSKGGELDRILNRLERTLEIRIPAILDDSDIVSDARRAANNAEKVAEVNLPADLASRGLAARTKLLAKRLSGHEIRFDVGFDRTSIMRAYASIAVLGRALRGFMVPAGLLSLVPALGGVAIAAGQAAGAINLLPAALAGTAIGLGAVMIGMQGFGTALSSMGDAEKFAEALKDLAPAARETAIAFRDLGPAWKDLRLDVQQQLFEGIGRTITTLGTTYLPVLQKGLRQTAAAIGAMGQVAGTALMRPESIAAVNTMLNQTAQAFRNAIPSLGDFLRGFVQVGAAGSTYLPRMATAVSDVATRFAEWSTAAAHSGRLNRIIDTAIATLSQLGRIVGNVGSALGGIFVASGAGAFLAGLELATARFAGFVNSAQGMTALQHVFSGVTAAVTGLGTAFSDVFQAALIHLGPVIEQLGPALGQLATQIGGALVAALQIAAPVLLMFATFLRENMTWLGPIIIAVGAFVAALAAIGPVITFVSGLATAFQLAALAFRVLSTALLSNPFVALAAAVIAIGVLIYSNWGAITSFLRSTWQTIASAGRSIWNGLASFFSGLWSRITGLFSSTWSRIRSSTSGAWRALVSVVSRGVSTVVRFVAGLPGRIRGALGNLGSLLWSAGADLVRGMINGVSAMIGNLLATVRNMAASAVNTVKSWLGISSPSRVFDQLGRWTGEGFARGIERGTPDAVTAATQMARSVAMTPVAAPAAPGFAGGRDASIQHAVTAGVLAGLDGARMRVDGNGIARLVNKTNSINARR